MGFARLIREGHAGPTTETQQEFLDDVLGSAEQLLAVINNNDHRAKELIQSVRRSSKS
jgi:hypothetical protein